MVTNGGLVRWHEIDPMLRELGERVTRLESKHEADASGAEARSNRVWLIVITVLSGVVAPLVVTAMIAWLHLRSA